MIKLVIKVGIVLGFWLVAILLVQEGMQVRERILAAENAQNEALIAIDHISYTLRTNDVVGRVKISRVEHINADGILIRHRTATDEFDRWIYFENGKLVEAKAEPGEQPDLAEYIVIADLYDFKVTDDLARSVISIEVSYEYNGTIHRITKVIGIRSDRGDGIIIL